MMELYILRHGTTAWNEKHLLQGRSDIPLDAAGRSLASEVGAALRDVHFDRCFSSPLKRAYETAELVLAGRGIPIEKDARLEEMSFGDFEGMDVSGDAAKEHPEVLNALKFSLEHYATPPHGETMEALLARTHAFYEDVINDPANEGRRILVSTHGGAGRALMHSVWGGNDFWHGSVPPNCSFCIVRVANGTGTCVKQDAVLYKEPVLNFYGEK